MHTSNYANRAIFPGVPGIHRRGPRKVQPNTAYVLVERKVQRDSEYQVSQWGWGWLLNLFHASRYFV